MGVIQGELKKKEKKRNKPTKTDETSNADFELSIIQDYMTTVYKISISPFLSNLH